MKTKLFSDAKIIAILNQAEGGVPIPQLCREHGISAATFYRWRSRYGGANASLIAENKALLQENRRIKRMYAEKSIMYEIVKEVLEKKV